ncbi:MAG: DUF2784 domain-containing protein [bacterium]|nr:MAG: DUF2784 domain-containing protein [bacterium]
MKILADILMLLHFLWAAFMVIGLPLGLILRSPTLRWVHFGGMMVTAAIAAVGLYCPLTVWEEMLRWKTDPAFRFDNGFLARHLSTILYPGVDPWIIRTATVAWGLLTLLSMILRWPGLPFPIQRSTR